MEGQGATEIVVRGSSELSRKLNESYPAHELDAIILHIMGEQVLNISTSSLRILSDLTSSAFYFMRVMRGMAPNSD